MNDQLFAKLRRVELPTLGHFLEHGFVDFGIKPVNHGTQLVAQARTLNLTVPDAIAVNRAILTTEPGQVLCIRVASGVHAPIGAVTAQAACSRGLAGIVVDGPVTDLAALERLGSRLRVFARGVTNLTTKKLGALTREVFDTELVLGGVKVTPGDLVLGDTHGIVIAAPDVLTETLVDRALASDAGEPELLARLQRGEPLAELIDTGGAGAFFAAGIARTRE